MKKSLAILFMVFGIMHLSAQGTMSEKDAKFIKEATEGGLLEVKLGEMAMAKGESTEIKQLGQMMVNDHLKVNKELQGFASGKNVNLPTMLSDNMQKKVDKLNMKSGKDFDKAYAKCMVKDHKMDICKFKKAAKKADDARIKSWASSTVPTLEHHKTMSESACKAVK